MENIFKDNNSFMIIAGPCAIESFESIDLICSNIIDDVTVIRGGAFKPRTSPSSFQGLKNEGISHLLKIKEKYNIPVVSEITDVRDIKLFNDIDIIQIGARNMQNFVLLEEVGKLNKPVLLKRGFGNTVDELVNATSYISKNGNHNIILCERGIRTFESSTRFTLDISAIPILKEKTQYKVIVDPSHAAGRRDLVIPLSKAAKAAGADGIIVEVHEDPSHALCDAHQQLDFKLFKELIEELKWIK